jgi:hypothetical protein
MSEAKDEMEVFCCTGFESLINDAGERGISALVYDTADGFKFDLQGRAVSRDTETFLTLNPTPLPAPYGPNITLSSNIIMNYCPYCGTKLRSVITPSNRRVFESIANKHASIYKRSY